jgi:DHA2 family multidrug resistance protein
MATIPAVMIVIVDSTVVNVALAKLGAVFGVDVSTVQWVITAFALALGMVTPLAAFLERRFTMKRVWLTCLITFTVSSVACGLSPAFWFLIVARLAQGLAGGLLIPMAISAIYQAFPLRERGTAMGAFAIPMVAGPALGPTVGGYIVTYQDWRLIFFINIPIGAIAVLTGLWLLHPSKPETTARFDTIGAILSSVAFGSILYSLSQVGSDGWDSPTVRGLMSFGIASLILFIIFEIQKDDPLLNMRLFAIPQFFIANSIGWVSTIALFGAEFMLPLYLQELRGLTALDTGILLLPQGLSIAIAGPIGGRLVDKIGPRPVVLFGFALLAVNTWQMSHITLDTTYDTLRWLLVARGLALGFTLQPTSLVSMSVVAPRLRTNASSVNTAMRGVFQSFGIAWLSTVVQTQTAVHTTELTWQVQQNTSQGAFLAQLTGLYIHRGISAVQAHAMAAQSVLGQIRIQGTVLGFADAYGVTFMAAIVAMLLAFLLPGRPLHAEPSMASAH